MDDNLIYKLLAFSFVVGSMSSMFTEVSSYLAPVDLISLRHASNRCKFEISREVIDEMFKTSIQEGLLPWNLSSNDLICIMKRCNLFLSGSFLMHAMIRDFTGLGDIDLWTLPSAPIFRTDTIKSFGFEVSCTSSELMTEEETQTQEAMPYFTHWYPGNVFKVYNFTRSPKSMIGLPDAFPKILSVIIVTGDRRDCRGTHTLEPERIVNTFDIDIVHMVMRWDLKCPLTDFNHDRPIPIIIGHLLRRQFKVYTDDKTCKASQILRRTGKYMVSKNLHLCEVCLNQRGHANNYWPPNNKTPVPAGLQR